MTITQKQLQEIFTYKDGCLYWKTIHSNKNISQIGKMAGHTRKSKYVAIKVNGEIYLAHRLIYLYHFGYFPVVLDHIDGNPSNNHIENLREATHAQNLLNAKLRSDSSSGSKNVSWHKRRNKWYVQMQVYGKAKSFGYYEDIELAELVATMAREKYHGVFANHK